MYGLEIYYWPLACCLLELHKLLCIIYSIGFATLQEKLCSMLKDVLKSKPKVDVVKLQKSWGVVSRTPKYRQKSRSYKIRVTIRNVFFFWSFSSFWFVVKLRSQCFVNCFCKVCVMFFQLLTSAFCNRFRWLVSFWLMK